MYKSPKEKCIFCWSGGKDSALALYRVLKENRYEVLALMTSLNAEFRRISMHGVREELLQAQAASIGIPLIRMFVSEGSNSEYERNMKEILLEYKSQGVTKVIFGDIFLEDLREYREKNLSQVDLSAEFPLWKEDTAALAEEFIALGFRTITCCVNDASLDETFAGVEFDARFLGRLPEGVDPCGENGEFHTFCYDGPIFRSALEIKKGELIYRPLELKTGEGASSTKGFWFCELLPA